MADWVRWEDDNPVGRLPLVEVGTLNAPQYRSMMIGVLEITLMRKGEETGGSRPRVPGVPLRKGRGWQVRTNLRLG